MISIFDIISYLLICFIAVIGTKMWSSIDFYFAEKAKNLATKQDVVEITMKTEAVQTEFHKIIEIFDADLAFKYQFCEKQYNDLYSQLYQKICESEGLRYVLNNLAEEHMNYSDFPVVEFASENEEDICQSYGDSTINQILNLVSMNYIYASPELVKIVSVLRNVEKQGNNLAEEKVRKSKIQLRKKLTNIIVEDYNRLRRELHFPGINDESGKLEKGEFIQI